MAAIRWTLKPGAGEPIHVGIDDRFAAWTITQSKVGGGSWALVAPPSVAEHPMICKTVEGAKRLADVLLSEVLRGTAGARTNAE